MASVHDIMTRQLLSLWPDDTAAEALDYLRMLNVHAAPVLDEQSHEPIGVISIGDLTGELATVRVSDRMSTPARVTIETAAAHEAADRRRLPGPLRAASGAHPAARGYSVTKSTCPDDMAWGNARSVGVSGFRP